MQTRKVIAQVEHQLLRAQLLACGERWAIVAATAALGTGVEIEDVFPRKVLDSRVTNPRRVHVLLL